MIKKINFRHISIYKSPDESPGYLLWYISTQWRSSIEKVLKPLSLTHPQFVVLATLAWLTKDNNKVSQIDISKMASLDPNTLSQILRGLESKKLIKRTQSINQRNKNPEITPLGSSILSKALPLVEQADTKFFKAFENNEIDELIHLFQKLIQKTLKI